MKTVEQDIEVYEIFDVYNVAYLMRDKIAEGWKVHTCLYINNTVLVVYERNLQTWN